MFTKEQQAIFDYMKGHKIPLIIKHSYENGEIVKSEFLRPIMKKSGAAFFIGGRIVKHKVAQAAYATNMVEFRA